MFIVFLYYSFGICNISNFIVSFLILMICVFHLWTYQKSAHLLIVLFSSLSMSLISALIFIALFILLAFILLFSFLSHSLYHEFCGGAIWVQWWPPGRNVHIPIPRIYKYCLILQNIKIRVLKRDTYPDQPWIWSQGTFDFLKGTFDLRDRKVVAIRPQRQRSGHKSRISWIHQKLEEASNRITPRDFGGLDFRLPASRPVRIDVC